MSVQELKQAIGKLSDAEFSQLARWIEEYRAEMWDRQVDADTQAGRLGEVGRKAEADFEAGCCRPL